MAAAGAPVGMAVQCTGVTRLQHEVEFGVLGPLEVRVAGRPIAVPGVRQRALLTALLLRRGIVVTFDRLVDEVFGKEPPEEARNALQTYVARLRHALGPAAAVVVTRAPGYVLDVPGHAVDTERFTTLLGKARHMHSPTAALALLDEALALWRGPAYAEFAETFARGETLRLHELWLAAQEDRAALLLRLGRLAESTAALEAIVAQEPWRERAVELLVSALAQAGRTPHALAVYTRYRDRLRDELGLDPSLRLRRLEEQVLRGELPPVQPHHAKRQPRTLPARATSFVGREQELALVRKTLAGGRLATLVGPGGVGKTRLAQQAAAAQRSVWWVDLAPLRDQDAVPHALADALDLDVQPGTPVLDTLRAWAGSARGLLVVDNCEHLLAAVAGVAEELLGACSALRLLATSRERLSVEGEQVLVVPPLAVPAPDAEEIRTPAVRLFCDRARAADPGFAPDREALKRVGDLCRALDGLPLAIELAAARIGTLTVDDLADRLDARFELLRTTNRGGGDARHHTLRGVVDWSFDLLTPEEQRLFLRLSVFAAAFDLAAAEKVVADNDLPAGRVADLVARLADRSMLTRPGHSGVGRYRMLETLRAFAAGRLPAAEAERLRGRHAGFMVDLAERAEAGLYGPDEPAWVRRVEAWLDDLRAAWSWARDAGEVDVAVRLAAALTRFAYWRVRSDILSWGTQAAAMVPAHPRLAVAHAVAAHAASGDLAGLAVAKANQALALSYGGNDQAACAAAREAVVAALASANPTAIAMARFAEGEALADLDPTSAFAALDEARRRAQDVGNRFVAGTALTATVALRSRHGPPDQALGPFRDAVEHWQRSGNRALIVTTLRNLVVLLARTGRDKAAVSLAATLQLQAPGKSYGSEAERIATALAAVRQRLGDAAYARAWAAGSARTLEAAAADAIRSLDSGPGVR